MIIPFGFLILNKNWSMSIVLAKEASKTMMLESDTNVSAAASIAMVLVAEARNHLPDRAENLKNKPVQTQLLDFLAPTLTTKFSK